MSTVPVTNAVAPLAVDPSLAGTIGAPTDGRCGAAPLVACSLDSVTESPSPAGGRRSWLGRPAARPRDTPDDRNESRDTGRRRPRSGRRLRSHLDRGPV